MKYFALILIVFSSVACTEPIEIDVQDGQTQLVVDAWLTNQAKDQKIILSYSQGYFNNDASTTVTGATVTLTDSENKVFNFVEENGAYIYKTDTIPFNVGNTYTLSIITNGETYGSTALLKGVPTIDSLRYEAYDLPIPDPDGGPDSGFLADFYANDIEGVGDTYWIQTTLNDTLNNNPQQINISYDGGFSPFSQSDGLLFILPIRQSINYELIQHNDKLNVKVNSISNEAYSFLQSIQTTYAGTGLFDVPPANLPTNIVSNSTKKALGFFNMASVSEIEVIIDSTKASPLQQ